MKLLMLILFAAMPAMLQAALATSRPFILPVAAEVLDTTQDGKGWLETGVARMTYEQAGGQFKSSLAQSGWKYLHTVSLSSRNDRSLLTWKRGNRELTMMLWRIDVGRTGFSWGIAASQKAGSGGNGNSGKDRQ